MHPAPPALSRSLRVASRGVAVGRSKDEQTESGTRASRPRPESITRITRINKTETYATRITLGRNGSGAPGPGAAAVPSESSLKFIDQVFCTGRRWGQGAEARQQQTTQ